VGPEGAANAGGGATCGSRVSYSIELYFDGPSDSRVRSIWSKVANLGAATMIESDSRPHVSLAVAESLEVGAVIPMLDRFARANKRFPLSLPAVGLFPAAEPVVFLAPKVTADLLELHRDFMAEFVPLAEGIWPYYMPEAWVPHCTITMGIRAESVGLAYAACHTSGLPLEVHVVGMSLVEFVPVKQLHETAFAE
jgi:2'-5' RNA ligase